eukprot:TRINITY_DN9360_c1_g1_i1.p1 TRINITY_DN9360_c1_g1~~TRINITY_DN9360_c1_g1_i1.p1  ORF type:complete len:145 (+),score=35.00 TRINITY_DN9360_c1_g1_i1:76-510(+)
MKGFVESAAIGTDSLGSSNQVASLPMPVVEAGFAIKGWCGPLFADPTACLEAAKQQVLTAAHYSSHAAGMVHAPSTKARLTELASRSSEAADQVQNGIEELNRLEAWQSSVGPGGLLLFIFPSAVRALEKPKVQRCPRSMGEFL